MVDDDAEISKFLKCFRFFDFGFGSSSAASRSDSSVAISGSEKNRSLYCKNFLRP